MKQELDGLIEDAMIAADGQATLPLHTAYELVTKAYKSGTNARVQLLAKALREALDRYEAEGGQLPHLRAVLAEAGFTPEPPPATL